MGPWSRSYQLSGQSRREAHLRARARGAARRVQGAPRCQDTNLGIDRTGTREADTRETKQRNHTRQLSLHFGFTRDLAFGPTPPLPTREAHPFTAPMEIVHGLPSFHANAKGTLLQASRYTSVAST